MISYSSKYLAASNKIEGWTEWFSNACRSPVLVGGNTIGSWPSAIDYVLSEDSASIIGEYMNRFRALIVAYAKKAHVPTSDVEHFIHLDQTLYLGRVAAAISRIPNYDKLPLRSIDLFPLGVLNDVTGYAHVLQLGGSKVHIQFAKECFDALFDGYVPLVTGTVAKPVVVRF
jgi:hypothetical protein